MGLAHGVDRAYLFGVFAGDGAAWGVVRFRRSDMEGKYVRMSALIHPQSEEVASF